MELRRVLLIGAAFAAICFGQSAGIVYLPVSYSATPAFTTTAGITNFSMTLGGNVTSSTFSSAATGTGSFKICQPTTGGTYTYTFAWMSNASGFPTVATGSGVCTTTTYAYDNGSVTLWATNVTGPAGPTGLTGPQGPSGSNGTGSGTVTSVGTGCGLAGGSITVSGTITAAYPVVVKTGNYTLLATDCGNIEQFSAAATVTVPQCGSTGFTVPWSIKLQNTSASATVTVNTSTSTFYGAYSGSTFSLSASQTAHLVCDGTNWDVDSNPPNTSATQTICSGTVALGTSAIASGAAASTVTQTCTGLIATGANPDEIILTFNGSPLAVTGYVPSANGMLGIISWPTSNTINVSVFNDTAASVTPGAITLNYRVVR